MISEKGRILVLDADSNASTAIVQSLGMAGYFVSLGGSSPDAPGKRSTYCRSYFQYPDPFESKDCFKNWIKDFLAQQPFDVVIPVADSSIYPLMELQSECPIDSAMLPRQDTFSLFFDKGKTLDLAKICQVPFPITEHIHSYPIPAESGWNQYPCFVKPVRSKFWIGDRGFRLEAALVQNPKEFAKAVERFSPFGNVLVQGHVPGCGVGIELFCEKGEILLAFAHQRIHEYPLSGGGSTYRVSIPMPPRLLNYASLLVEAARWDGVAMVEFKVNDDEAYLMEVNGRFWGSLPLSIRSGANFPKASVEWKLSKKFPDQHRYRTGIYGRKLKSDTIWLKENIRADKNDPLLLTRPVSITLLEYLRILKGTERWDHAYFRDPLPIVLEIGQTLWELFSPLQKPWKWITRKIYHRMLISKAKMHSEMVLASISPRKILVLCLGNICRSPVAEHCLKRELTGNSYEIASCGFIPTPLRQTPTDFQKIASDHGIDLTDHRSEVISRSLCQWADLIIIMDRENWIRLEAFDESVLSKTVWLGAFRAALSPEIADPFRGTRNMMISAIQEIEDASKSLAHRLLSRDRLSNPQ